MKDSKTFQRGRNQPPSNKQAQTSFTEKPFIFLQSKKLSSLARFAESMLLRANRVGLNGASAEVQQAVSDQVWAATRQLEVSLQAILETVFPPDPRSMPATPDAASTTPQTPTNKDAKTATRPSENAESRKDTDGDPSSNHAQSVDLVSDEV